MRPYLLAFMVVVWFMLARSDFGLGKTGRIIMACFSVVVALASVALYMYLSKYYMTPYFYRDTIANDFFSRIVSAMPSLVSKHVSCILYSGAKLVQFGDQGIVMFTFAACWVMFLVMFVKAHKRGDSLAAALFLALVVVGVAVFEAHMLLYRYQQMQRTMLYKAN